MNELNKLINHFKEQKNNLSELELVRYVYIYLGKILSFDINFLFGNTELRKQIYRKCSKDEKELNKNLENQQAICKSIAYLIEYILNKLDIKVESITDYYENVPYPHLSNIVFLKNGLSFPIDLQHDLENIQTNYRTSHFGDNISDEILEQIDYKIGYIKEEQNYTEEYLYMLELALTPNLPLPQKIKFILDNIDVYCDISNMKYSERKNYYYNFIQKFIDKKEKNKLHFIDCYKMTIGLKEYQFCVIIDIPNNDNIVYIYSNQLQKFQEYNLEDITNLLKQGYVFLGNIPGIKKYNQKVKSFI